MLSMTNPPEILRQWSEDAVRKVIIGDVEVDAAMLRAIADRGATEAIQRAAEADLERYEDASGEECEPTNLAETVFEYRYCQCEDPEPIDAVPVGHPQYPLKECDRCGGEL